MSKLKNHIFLTICEVSLKCFDKSSFSNYTSYCSVMGLSLKAKSLSKNQTSDMYKIIEMLDKIYGMDETTIGNLIFNYFTSNMDVIREFEKCVLLNQEVFPEI